MGRGNDADDLVWLVGLGIVGFMAWREWYYGMSIEQIAQDIDAKARGFLDDILGKLPALPPVPQFLPPTAPPAATAAPQMPLDVPTKEGGEPVKSEDETGQLPKEVSDAETEKANNPKAAPSLPPTPSNVKGPIVAITGDWDNNAKAKQTVASMQRHGVQFVIGVGDNGYDSDATTWFNAIMTPFKGRIKSALGNHDAKEEQTYARLFGQSPGIWNFVQPIVPGKLSVVFIDTEKGIQEASLDSLTKTAKSQARHVAYVFHKPYITSSDGHHKPSENKWSAIIDRVAKKYGVRLLAAGHNHNYEHFMCNGTHYVTSGAAGRKFYSTGCKACGPVKCVNNTNGWLKVTVGNDLFLEFVSNAGQVLDSFTISASGNDAQAVQQFLRAYISPEIYITRNRR